MDNLRNLLRDSTACKDSAWKMVMISNPVLCKHKKLRLEQVIISQVKVKSCKITYKCWKIQTSDLIEMKCLKFQCFGVWHSMAQSVYQAEY